MIGETNDYESFCVNVLFELGLIILKKDEQKLSQNISLTEAIYGKKKVFDELRVLLWIYDLYCCPLKGRTHVVHHYTMASTVEAAVVILDLDFKGSGQLTRDTAPRITAVFQAIYNYMH